MAAKAGAEAGADAAVAPVSGRFLEPETGLAVRVGEGVLHFTGQPETLAGGPNALVAADGGIRMERPGDGMASLLAPVSGEPARDIEGAFSNEELGATLTCASAGGVLYGAFSGPLGQGAMQALLPFGDAAWLLPCPRALDHAPPGDWTLALERGEDGRVAALRVGCWLARGLVFRRVRG